MANAQVMTFTTQRTEERMGITTGALKDSRTNSDIAYCALVKIIKAFALVEDKTDYADFIDYVNTEITHYKQEVISGRSALGKEEEKEKE